MAENKTENPGTEEMEVRLAQLNQFTRRTLTQEEVFLFDVRLCDNEIDRDGERFSLEALEQLKTLFVGKTGILTTTPRERTRRHGSMRRSWYRIRSASRLPARCIPF